MITTKRRGLRVTAACAVVVMLLLSMLPGSPLVMSPRVGAYGENEEGTLFYAEATLYDYKYDREVGGYNYDHDNQIAYVRNGDGVKMSQEECHNLINGDRWMTGLQVPYEKLNRKLSAFYGNTSVPGLYLGNFYGTATNLPESRGNNEGQTPWQYTYIDGQSNNASYVDAYKNFWESANAAPLNNNGNVAIQGLVDRKLTNGKLTQGNGAVEMPLFSQSFINANSDLMKVYPTSNGFPFNIIHNADGTKTYRFDSAYDAPRYYSNGAFAIGTLAQNGVANWRSDGKDVTAGGYGFFPFNSSAIHDTEVGRQSVNYGFGMKVDIPFNLNENGTILDKDNHEVDVVFEFSGDDDVWVFVDDVLMLDLGGDHAKVQGSINFNRNKQSVWIDHASTFNRGRSRYEKATSSEGGSAMNSNIAAMFSAAGESFNADSFYHPNTQHTLTVFYMERGMFESNLSISFNFATLNPHKLTVREQTKFYNINSALLQQTVAVADRDIFAYSIENKGTGTASVKDSGFKAPTYEYINRNNTEAGNTALINRLSGQPAEYTEQMTRHFDEDHIYFRLPSDWPASGHTVMAWAWRSGVSGSSRYIEFAYDSDSGYYKAERQGCDKMKPVLFASNSRPAAGSTNWSSPVKQWGDDVTIPGNKNLFNEPSNQWSDKVMEIVTPVQVLKQETNNFAPEGDDFNTVGHVTYQLTDPFGVTYPSGDIQQTLYRHTADNGVFGLMYGEDAYFQYQFQKSSTMRVKQADVLMKPMENRAETMGSQPGTRQTADYYFTTVEVQDARNNQILSNGVDDFDRYNREDGTYLFANAPSNTDKVIHLTETYVNVVKVGDLVISKDVEDETDSPVVFTFDVTLSELFGDDSGTAVNIDELQYEVFPKGTTDIYGTTPSSYGMVRNGIKITEQQIAAVKGIPVNTRYTVSERPDSNYAVESMTGDSGVITAGSYTYSPDGDITGTIIHNSAAPSAYATAVNKRKVGELVITKTVTGGAADLSDTFPVTVNFTAPTDGAINFADFVTREHITRSGAVTNFALNGTTVTFDVANGASVTIGNIPYGTTYTVSEEAGDYTQTIDYSDTQKIINDTVTATAAGQTDTVSITNTREAARIVLTKKNDRGTMIGGAEFAIVCEVSATGAEKALDYTVSYTKSSDGKIFTFDQLRPNTTYRIAETHVPEGHTGVEPFTVTTGAAGSVTEMDVINPVIDIVMPETGVLPAPLNMTVIGLSVIGLAVWALLIYRRKLQTATADADDKGVSKGT